MNENCAFDEEKLIRDNINFIRHCAWSYITETGLDRSWFDDVVQEASIAYLLWRRKLAAGMLGENGWKYASVSIRYHLMNKFVDRHGVGVTYRSLRVAPPPPIENYGLVREDVPSASDTERAAYLKDWFASLSAEDQDIVRTHIITGRRSKRFGKSPSTYNYHLKKIRRSYDEYFAG